MTKFVFYLFIYCSDVAPESTAPEPPSNIVTSWGDNGPAKAPSQAQKKSVPVQPRRYSSSQRTHFHLNKEH